jgi:hypothetical protein
MRENGQDRHELPVLGLEIFSEHHSAEAAASVDSLP